MLLMTAFEFTLMLPLHARRRSDIEQPPLHKVTIPAGTVLYGTKTAQRRTFYAVKGSKLPHNGDGCVKLSNGAVTTGCFANGELSLGVFTYGSGVGVHDGLDGGVYKGSFGKDFTFHGTGTLTYANGTVLRATWTDGACMGSASFTLNDGRQFETEDIDGSGDLLAHHLVSKGVAVCYKISKHCVPAAFDPKLQSYHGKLVAIEPPQRNVSVQVHATEWGYMIDDEVVANAQVKDRYRTLEHYNYPVRNQQGPRKSTGDSAKAGEIVTYDLFAPVCLN